MRILIQYALSEDDQLSSAAFRLIFRCFSQRKELLDDLLQVRGNLKLNFYFFQVQLLITVEDRNCYDQILHYSILLKNCTEKSELWLNEPTANGNLPHLTFAGDFDGCFERRMSTDSTNTAHSNLRSRADSVDSNAAGQSLQIGAAVHLANPVFEDQRFKYSLDALHKMNALRPGDREFE